MKILKIAFQNINSLKGEHEIDFTAAPFTSSSLFAITGPTGSGKSTILDVISLALFNQVPRLGKISKGEILSKGALLTRNQKEANARVTYESKNGVFESVWSISTARTGNLRDYEMQIFEFPSGRALDLKKSDVPAKNEELIGLNYDQFIKSVLLAQGEFAQFLKARKDERGELLEKITGTGIYRKVGVKAFQKFKEVNSEIENERRESNLLQKDLLEEEFLNTLKQSLSEKELGCAPVEKTIAELEQKIQLKKNIREQIVQIERQTKSRETTLVAFQNFEKEHGPALQKHEQVQLFARELREWVSLSEKAKDLKDEILELREKEKKNSKEISTCLESIKNFIREEADADNIEQKLQEFSVKIRQLQKHRDEKLNSYKNISTRFNAELREIPFQLSSNVEESEKHLRELCSSTQQKLSGLKDSLSEINLEEPTKEKTRLKTILGEVRKAQHQRAKLENISLALNRNRKEQETISPQLKDLPEKIKLMETEVKFLSEREENLQLKRQNQLLQASLEEHRRHLKEGEPCPLCGAVHHPFSENVPHQQGELQKEINFTSKELGGKRDVLAAERTSLNHFKRQLEELKNTEKSLVTELEREEKEYVKHFENLQDKSGAKLEKLCENYEKQFENLEKFEQEQRRIKAIQEGIPLLEELKKVLKKGKEIKEELDDLYAGKDINTDCLELQNSWRSFQHQQKSFAELAKELDRKLTARTGELKELEEELIPALKEKGCTGIEDALKRLMPETRYLELRKTRENLSQETAKINAALKTLQEQLDELLQKDVQEDSDFLSSTHFEQQNLLKTLQKECEELRRKLRNDEDLRKRIGKIEANLAEKKKRIRRWELLNQLIGDSTGKKFNDFAQDLSLSQLLQLTNLRLKDLSDRYRIGKPVAEEDEGLVAIDEHMGGQRRSVKTLSGGETFILSLAMALALSDLASKNVEINSLFIDEGFGTLDPETLDQTLDTLEKLQAESSKTIGIISHVDSLKERIATQIQLKRNGQGYSSLEVRG